MGRNMAIGTSLPTWTSCWACPRKESKFWPKEYGYVVLIEVSFYGTTITIPDELSTGDAQDSTSTSYLAVKAEMGTRWLL